MKIFYIIGKSASGKDTIFKHILKSMKHIPVKPIILYTTRPMRDGEENGVDYHFISTDEFKLMIQHDMVIEARVYNTTQGEWAYVTPKFTDKETDAGNVYLGIGTLESYGNMKHEYGDDVIPIYINVDDETRIYRALDREKSQSTPNYKEMCRRFIADCDDFSDDRLAEYNIDNVFDNYDLTKCCNQIRGFIGGYILKSNNI